MQEVDEARIDQALEAASGRIDLDRIATGPADETGFGAGTEPYQLLDMVLQGLEQFPGRGERFAMAALKSPVTRNRFGATRTLAAWGIDRWSSSIRAAIAQPASQEPDEDARTRMKRVLDGGAFDDAGEVPDVS